MRSGVSFLWRSHFLRLIEFFQYAYLEKSVTKRDETPGGKRGLGGRRLRSNLQVVEGIVTIPSVTLVGEREFMMGVYERIGALSGPEHISLRDFR